MTDRELLEKIVTQMDKGFKDVNTKVDGLSVQVDSLTNQMDGLQSEMQEGFREAYYERQEMKSVINKIEMRIENDINKNINLLVEGQQNINAKIDEVIKIKDEKELLSIRIEILENEITRMKSRLDEIA